MADSPDRHERARGLLQLVDRERLKDERGEVDEEHARERGGRERAVDAERARAAAAEPRDAVGLKGDDDDDGSTVELLCVAGSRPVEPKQTCHGTCQKTKKQKHQHNDGIDEA